MNQYIVHTNDLQKMLGLKTIESLERYLIKNHIPYLRGHGTITTTIQAINTKLGINEQVLEDDFQVL